MEQPDIRRKLMNEENELYVLWTSGDPVTAEKMVFMYTINALLQGWWEKVTLIVWGAPARLVSEDAGIRKLVARARETGVHITACKACADQLGVTEALQEQGIEVKYWGEPLTELLKNGKTLLSV